MQGRFKMEYKYRLFTIVRYNYRDYNIPGSQYQKKKSEPPLVLSQHLNN